MNAQPIRHLTGEVVDGEQRCERCGRVITPMGLTPFEVGVVVFVDAARGTWLATPEDLVEVDVCIRPN